MDRLKRAFASLEQPEKQKIKDRVEVVGVSIASCLNRASDYLAIELSGLDYEIIERGEDSYFRRKPYRIHVSVLPEEERFADLKQLSEKLWGKQSLLDKDLEHFTKEEDADGSAVIRNYRKGVFLIVTPPTGKGYPVNKEAVLRKVQVAGLKNFDPLRIGEAIHEASGKLIRIGDFEHSPEGDSTCRVEISPDGMKASIRITPPQRRGRHLELSDIISILKSHGIVLGFKEDKIRKMLFIDLYLKDTVAAEGVSPRHGLDSRIDYKINIKKGAIHLREDSSGKVDFKNLNLVENVVSGQVLSEKLPAEKGKNGHNLFNHVVEARSGRDTDMSYGKGTLLSNDGKYLMAETNGQVVISRGKISVEPIHRVLGDVGPKTGNILFLGSVVVYGSVLDNYEIKAVGNVEISGGVQKASVEAEGEILIHSGIQGGMIESSSGSVIAKFIQNAKISAFGDVAAGEGIIHSTVSAGGSVFCGGRRAQIVGGVIRVAKELRARVVGSQAYTSTEISAGTDPKIIIQCEDIQKHLRDIANKISQTEKTVSTLTARRGGAVRKFSTEQENMLQKAKESLVQLTEKQKELKEELAIFKEEIDMNKANGKIHVEKQLYPGVFVTIQGARHSVSDTYKAVTLSAKNGHIKIGKLEPRPRDINRYYTRRRTRR